MQAKTDGRQQGSNTISVNGVFRWVLSKAEPDHMTEVTEGVRAARFPQGLPRSQGNRSQNHPPKHRGWGHWHFRFPSEASMPCSPGLLLLTYHHIREGPTTKVEKMLSECQGQSMSSSFSLVPRPHLHNSPPLGWSFATWELLVLGHKVPELPATQREGGMSAFFLLEYSALTFLQFYWDRIDITHHM